MYSQISLDLKNKTVKEILKEIERKSDYSFFYNEDLKDLNKTTSIQVSNVSLEVTLNLLLKETGITFKKQNDNIVLLIPKETAFADNTKTISGTVLDSNGEPVIGANVSIKGTGQGTTTNPDGKFELNVPEDGSLVLSYLGFANKEIPIRGKSVFQITLEEDTQLLDEVVVIGYSTVRRRDLTGSVSQINSEKFERVPTTNVMSALQGRLSGLTITPSSGRPGADSDVLIHGIQSINGSNSPIYVVDGMIQDGSNNINPQDIETLTVLKDASAVAIYGSRAANGVILINTKRGNNVPQPTITFKTEQSIQQEGNLRLGFVNAAQWLELAAEAYENAGTAVPWTSADLAKVEGVDVNWPDARKFY
ncbi:hypothetical protein FACS189432_07030 [Bacteroidia bacterium]|nr:hypothetical protein FACS189426_15540 [Bacteroidia bacterium]GHT28709.1 hypothetical protein FACS189432_07030 [Bacteroidia bacterium]